ncbi:uncharacterized protein LOC100200506 [Hydra vulgaris]|uniref:uncharacterized protein LOC100200506 n=1 Tax=Hydra vulgaris TaxID=6087 RepID=UPI0002B441BA|nr:uncharacterized protein LOC100200506 [Hydra vulgaris]
MKDVCGFRRGFKPPTMYELQTWILKEEKNAILFIVHEAKLSWIETGCSIMSDGWTYTNGRTLINFLVNNPKGTYFLKSIDASDQVKDAKLLFKLLDEVVEEVGEKNIIQVITDNVSAYKTAGRMLMEKKKNLYWTPCAAHCIELMLEDIFKLPFHTSVFTKAKKIINFIYGYAWVLAMVRKFTGGDLVKPAVTRFVTAFLTFQSLFGARDELESFFTSRKWKTSSYASRSLGKNVRNIVLKSKSFWPGVVYMLNATKPLVIVL